MSFKKTATFTANVGDYTDGTVSARVQAENKILADLVAFILAQGLNIQLVEKVSIGDEMWSGDPLHAVSGASRVVSIYNLLTDVYFLGHGAAKKCLGLSIDNHVLYFALTPTASNEMQYTLASYYTGGRISTNQLRYILDFYRPVRKAAGASIDLATFSETDDTLSLTLAYYKSAGNLVLTRVDGTNEAVVITKTPATVLLYSGTGAIATHYSLDDDFTCDATTYLQTASNSAYAANTLKEYAMSYNPFCALPDSDGAWTRSPVSTALVAHRIGIYDLISNEASTAPANPANGMNTGAAAPAYNLYGFPRVKTTEIYIRKQYIPMTYPATKSPIYIGYTPGILYPRTVYKINGKFYLSLVQGVIGYFVEVADQG